jgi:hypothetical protein
MRHWLRSRFLLALPLAIVPACAGGNGTSHGMPDSGGAAVDSGDGGSVVSTVTIPQIQDATATGHAPTGAHVRVRGVRVAAVDTFEENGTGMGRTSDVWVADVAGGPFSGVQVVSPSVTTCPGQAMLARGDTVDVEGMVREDADPTDGTGRTVTQIAMATITCTTPGDGVGPDAAPITDPSMLTSDATAEPWEGVLIELTAIDATSATDTMGSQTLRNAPPIDDDLYRYVGTRRDHFDSIRGVFTYEIGRWELLPRAMSDLTVGTPRMIEDGAGAWACADAADSDGDGAVDCADTDCVGSAFCRGATITVQDLQDPSRAAHPAVMADVALVGPLTVTSIDAFAEASGPGYIGTIVVQDATATDPRFSGVHVFVPRVEACGSALALGDQVYVAGQYAEYAATGDTASRTELQNGIVSCRSAGTPIAATPIAMPADLAAAATAEPYEGVLVSIGGVSVTMPPGTYGRFQVTGGVYVDDDVYRATVTVGDALSSVIGVLTYSFGYQLEPRMASDVVIGPTEHDDTSCGNGLDDDADGHADCEDVDCCTTAPCMGAVSARRLVLSEVLYDVLGGGATGDDGHEWVEIRNAGTSAVPLSCYTLGNGTTNYRYSFTQLPATSIPAGGCILVGGPDCGGPACTDTINFNPDLHNVTAGAAAGVALMYGLTSSITDATVPVDAVIYGDANTGHLLDATGTAPSGTMVPTVTAGHSISRTATGGWADTTPPTPGTCTTFSPP